MPKCTSKVTPKIDIWVFRGQIFEILGCFLRSRIFEGFLIGEKSAKSLKIGGLGLLKAKFLRFWGGGGR